MRPALLTLPLLCLLSRVPVRSQTNLEALNWMAGSWQGTVGEGVMEEVWTPARGHTMLGLHRDVEGERTTSF